MQFSLRGARNKEEAAAASQAATGSAPAGQDAVSRQLGRILASKQFRRSVQLSRLLEHLVKASQAGRSEELSEYAIATGVLGRDDSFDPRLDNIVRSEISRLRKKLKEYYENESDPEVLVQLPSGSYSLEFNTPDATRKPARTDSGARSRLKAAAAAFALLAVGMSLFWIFAGRTGAGANDVAYRLAVVPFQSLANDEAGNLAAALITDSLTTSFSKRRGLEVVSLEAAAKLASEDGMNDRRIEALSLDFILEGSVLRTGENCRVTARLVDTAAKTNVWAEEYEFPWSDVFVFRAKIPDAVAATIGLPPDTLQPARAGVIRERNLPAYEAFAAGRLNVIQFNNSRIKEYAFEAERRLERAIQLEPDFAEALAQLGRLAYLMFHPPLRDRDELVFRARSYLHRALAIDPENTTALTALSSIEAWSGHWAEGLELAQTAVKLNPGGSVARMCLGDRWVERGFYEAADQEYLQAAEADPIHMDPYLKRAHLYALMNRPDDALRLVRVYQVREPLSGDLCRMMSANALFRAGNPGGAHQILQAGSLKFEPVETLDYLRIAQALAMALQADLQAGRAVIKEYAGSPPRYMDHYLLLLVASGEHQDAIRRFATHPMYSNYRYLSTNPLLKPLHGDPGFQRILRNSYRQWMNDLAKARTPSGSEPPKLHPPEKILGPVGE